MILNPHGKSRPQTPSLAVGWKATFAVSAAISRLLARFRTVRMAVSIPVRPIVSTTNHVGVISAITIGSVLLQPPAPMRGAGAEDRARPNRDSIPILLQLILEPTKHLGPGAMR